MTHLKPLLGSLGTRREARRSSSGGPVASFAVGRSRAERSRAAIPGELRQQRARPKAFSKDQGLLKSDKLTLETVWRRGRWMKEKKKERLNETIGKTGVACQQID